MTDKKELRVSLHPFDETMRRVLRVKPEQRAEKPLAVEKPATKGKK